MTVIYVLRCPIAKAVRYVGKTKYPEKRLQGHLIAARGRHVSHHCANWIRSLLAQDLAPSFEVIHVVQADESWQEVEARFIAQYRAEGHPLTNGTAGGDGFHDIPPEVLKKRSKAQGKVMKELWADPEVRARFMKAREGSHSSPEVRARMSAAIKKAYEREEARAANSMAQKEAWARKSTSELEKLSAKTSSTMKAQFEDPETKAARLAAMHTPEAKAKRYTPEKIAARSEKLKAAWADPERRARRIAQMLSPEGRERKSMAMAEVWARRRATT